MNKNTLIFAVSLLFIGTPCFSSVQSLPLLPAASAAPASNPELRFHNVTIPPRAFNAKTYNGPLNTLGTNVIGLKIGTQDEAIVNGWNFAAENRFQNGELVLLKDPNHLHGNHFGEVVVVVGVGPYQKTYPKNPISQKMSQTYHIQCGFGGVHPLINDVDLGKFEKTGIMLTPPSFAPAFTVEQLENLTVSLPEGALPEPVPSPDLIDTRVLPLLGATADTDLLESSNLWHTGEAFEEGELAFAYSFDGAPIHRATLGIIIEESVSKNSCRIQMDAQGTIKTVEKKYLVTLFPDGAITKKNKELETISK